MSTERPTPRTMTIDEYLAMPEEGFFELVDGVLRVSPSGTVRNQEILANLLEALRPFVRQHGLGRLLVAPFDVVLRREWPPLVYQPDLLFVRREREAIVERRWVEGPPDLAIEILSPSNARDDMVRKRHDYERYGVGEYWMVMNETDHVLVTRLGADGRYAPPTTYEPGMHITSPLLPGLELDVARVFDYDEPSAF